MKALIIGAGSIGLRHAEILVEMGLECDFISNRKDITNKTLNKLEDVNFSDYSYFIIANETSKHFETFKKINSLVSKKIVLIENPLFTEFQEIIKPNNTYYIGYNLRFHDAIVHLKKQICVDDIIFIDLCCCHFLPDWNPWRDYRETYSAKKLLGGGVLKDLTHEIDLLYFITEEEKINFEKKIYRKISNLEIETNDFFKSIGTIGNINFSLSLDYISRIPRRQITIYTHQSTYILDLINSKLSFKGHESEYDKSFSAERNKTYQEMHKSILFNEGLNASTLEDGQRVLKWF